MIIKRGIMNENFALFLKTRHDKNCKSIWPAWPYKKDQIWGKQEAHDY